MLLTPDLGLQVFDVGEALINRYIFMLTCFGGFLVAGLAFAIDEPPFLALNRAISYQAFGERVVTPGL